MKCFTIVILKIRRERLVKIFFVKILQIFYFLKKSLIMFITPHAQTLNQVSTIIHELQELWVKVPQDLPCESPKI